MNPETHPLTILVVDDNRANRHLVETVVRRLGHQAISATNGEEAVRAFREQRPDLVLLDILMPVMDGFEAARQMRATAADYWVPIVFLSALDRDANLIEGLEAGGDDFIGKPLNFVVLEARIRSLQRAIELQHRATQALRHLQMVSDNVLDAIVTMGSDCVIRSASRACETLFGYPAESLIGQNVSILMPEPHRSEHDAYVQRYLQGGPPNVIGVRRALRAVHRNGREFPVEIAISETGRRQDRVFLAVIRDLSDRS